MESPPKRLKIAPPLLTSDMLLHSQKKHPAPSKLPIHGSSTLRSAPSYIQSPRSKGSLGLARRSPYGERPASARSNGGAEGVKLNFGTLQGAGSRFRRAGGPRLSQSPARRSTFFNDQNPSSGAQRMSILGAESDSLAESSPDTGSSSPEQAQGSKKKKKEILKTVLPSPTLPTKRPPLPPKTAEEKEAELIEIEHEALRKLLEARVNALRMEVDTLQEEVQKEEARVERDTRAVPKPGGNNMEALVKRLLSANDSSHASLPTICPTPSEIPSAKPLVSADPLSQLSAFHCLTFTSTTTTTITSPELLLADHPITTTTTTTTTATQRHSTSGFAANRLLFFKLTFDVSTPSWHVSRTTYTVSPWARQELQPPLDRAASECDINSILYALSSYTTLAQTRATVFAALGRAFPNLLPVLAPREGCRRELVSWLGVTLLRFRHRDVGGGTDGVELVISWNIMVGIGGEAESRVTADVRMPGHWTDADEMRSFAKVGDVFRSLVKERGVFEATKCVVGLVFQ